MTAGSFTKLHRSALRAMLEVGATPGGAPTNAEALAMRMYPRSNGLTEVSTMGQKRYGNSATRQVSGALNELKRRGLATIVPINQWTLTPEGEKQARSADEQGDAP